MHNQYDSLNSYTNFKSNKIEKMFEYFLQYEMQQTEQQRNTFLNPPNEDFKFITSNNIIDIINSINKKLAIVREYYDNTSRVSEQLFWYEGLYSSLIENESSKLRVEQSVLSIKHHTMKSNTRRELEKQLLKTHKILMKDLMYADPGAYRNVRVRVGSYIAPPPSLVQQLMSELIEFIYSNQHGEIITAAYAHICFETIHPFIDGNGRTGRSLISNIFNLPIPLSKYIWNTRSYYYRMLNKSSWNNYFEYFLICLNHALDFMIETLTCDTSKITANVDISGDT